MNLMFCNDQSLSWLLNPTVWISFFALIVSGLTLYLTFLRRAKVSSLIPKAVIIRILDNSLLLELRDVFLLNSTTNRMTAIKDLWLVLKEHENEYIVNFDKEKMIQVGIQKFDTIPSKATWSTSTLINLSPMIPRISEMHFICRGLKFPYLASGDYEFSFHIIPIERRKSRKLWQLKIRLAERIEGKRHAIGINLDPKEQPIEFRMTDE